jgi:exonuclease III
MLSSNPLDQGIKIKLVFATVVNVIMSSQLKLLNWNVRGLNDRARRFVVHDLATTSGCLILCVQESKLATLSDEDKADIVGQTLTGCVHLPADDTRGGVLLFWNEDTYLVSNINIASFSITAKFTDRSSNVSWHLTTVYGPADDDRKLAFLNELVLIHSQISGAWMVIGDFNLILSDQDKNKRRVNRAWMRRFKNAVDSSFLREIKLVGRRYTWSNEQSDPTLVRLDRAFCNDEWDDLFQASKLLPQASSMSDHYPLLLVQDTRTRTLPRFRFESFWPLLQGYNTVVEQSWKSPCLLTNQFAVLDYKLKRLAKDLKTWAKNYVGDIRKQMLVGQEIMLC